MTAPDHMTKPLENLLAQTGASIHDQAARKPTCANGGIHTWFRLRRARMGFAMTQDPAVSKSATRKSPVRRSSGNGFMITISIKPRSVISGKAGYPLTLKPADLARHV